MKRRTFIQHAAAASLAALAGPARYGSALDPVPEPMLRGLIVSDAHFGWENEQQPDPEAQRAAMKHLLGLANVDVIMDTGDAYHGNLRGANGDVARGQWLDIIANGAGARPFLYVPGNHEIVGTGEGDHEERCCRLGSLSCRPYYSFDIQGIHFVSIPQMVRAIYVTRETLEWLSLDLNAHRDKTTIILSHNNIKGTTGPIEPGYRGLVNGNALTALFEAHPQVAAWMHGHNHNYEVVRRGRMLYVSNGRIGGFDPSLCQPSGSHGIGGIYFSISSNQLAVRAYSAERGCFLDTLGIENVSGVLEMQTSLAPDAPAACSYGYGGALDGQRMPVYHHFVGSALSRTLILGGVNSPVFNDDPSLALYDARNEGKSAKDAQKMLMGSDVRGRNGAWRWADPGVIVTPQKDSGRRLFFSVPRAGQGKVNYFRCAPGKKYCFRTLFTAEGAGGEMRLAGYVYDSAGNTLYEAPVATHPVAGGQQELLYYVEAPAEIGPGTIYKDQNSDIQMQIAVEIELAGLKTELLVQRVELYPDPAGGTTLEPAIVLNGTRYTASEACSGDAHSPIALPPEFEAREVIECRASGNQRLSWLIREEGIAWQVRNAAACMRDGWLEIGPVRADWGAFPVIVVAPVARCTHPFVHRLNKVTQASIRMAPADTTIELRNLVYAPGATLEIHGPVPPHHVAGGRITERLENLHIVEISAPEMILSFS